MGISLISTVSDTSIGGLPSNVKAVRPEFVKNARAPLDNFCFVRHVVVPVSLYPKRMIEIEKKYLIPQAQVERFIALLESTYGLPKVLDELDLHGYTNPEKTHYLRLRRSGEKLQLVAKGPSQLSEDGFKQRKEVTVPLTEEQFGTAMELVELLATFPLPTMERQRKVWKLSADSEIVVDNLKRFPDRTYAEIEVLAKVQADALDRLRSLESSLGLDPSWVETRNYGQILLDSPVL
jgi:adenylate cyclase class IV